MKRVSFFDPNWIEIDDRLKQTIANRSGPIRSADETSRKPTISDESVKEWQETENRLWREISQRTPAYLSADDIQRARSALSRIDSTRQSQESKPQPNVDQLSETISQQDQYIERLRSELRTLQTAARDQAELEKQTDLARQQLENMTQRCQVLINNLRGRELQFQTQINELNSRITYDTESSKTIQKEMAAQLETSKSMYAMLSKENQDLRAQLSLKEQQLSDLYSELSDKRQSSSSDPSTVQSESAVAQTIPEMEYMAEEPANLVELVKSRGPKQIPIGTKSGMTGRKISAQESRTVARQSELSIRRSPQVYEPDEPATAVPAVKPGRKATAIRMNIREPIQTTAAPQSAIEDIDVEPDAVLKREKAWLLRTGSVATRQKLDLRSKLSPIKLSPSDGPRLRNVKNILSRLNWPEGLNDQESQMRVISTFNKIYGIDPFSDIDPTIDISTFTAEMTDAFIGSETASTILRTELIPTIKSLVTDINRLRNLSLADSRDVFDSAVLIQAILGHDKYAMAVVSSLVNIQPIVSMTR